MPAKIKKLSMKSYSFKLPQKQSLQWFQALITEAAEKLLMKLWSEEWIKAIGEKNLKAYKVVNEAQVKHPNGYLPSRVRRGIAERVGRIIRGQYKRMKCFYSCMMIVEWLGIETKIGKLISIAMQHCRSTTKNGQTYPTYKKVMVQQTIAMIKNWHKKLAIDFTMFSYTNFVQPTIATFSFPYGPDDGNAIQYENTGQNIKLRIKLPKTPQPTTKRDWEWVEKIIPIPVKVQEKISRACSIQPAQPTLGTKILKGGLKYFFLKFPWEFPRASRKVRQERVLALDLGLKKLATAVICETGNQISPPITLKLVGGHYRHIERLYKNIAGIQQQLARLQKRSRPTGVTPKEEERRRLYEKRNRLGEELAHTTTNIVRKLAHDWRCTKIVIEDLRSYKPPKGRRSWSRRLSEWFRGRIAFLLEYKCQEYGLILQKVCPWNTSSHCPRCSKNGVKVLGPNNMVEDKRGRWFHCPTCRFTADRDYIAAVNIYRASFIDYQTIKSLKDTSPIPYMDIGTPHSTVLSGGSEMNPNDLIAVTGFG